MKRILAILYVLFSAYIAHAVDYSFDIPDTDNAKESLEISGSLSVMHTGQFNRTNSTLYALQNSMSALPPLAFRSGLGLYLNGDYNTKHIGFHAKTYQEYVNDSFYHFNLLELYGEVNINQNLSLATGKKRYEWGKGYAFNPAGYPNPAKNPENPELSKAGIVSLDFAYSLSLPSDLMRNITFNLIAAVPEETATNTLYDPLNTLVFGKLYFLVWDTDLDIMGFYGRNQPVKAGIDFSRNIIPSLEIHGEYSYSHGQETYTFASGFPVTNTLPAHSYLFGIRWLNDWNMTFIFEYYHNDAGMTSQDYVDYYEYLTAAVNAGNISSATSQLKNMSRLYSFMRDYLYLKVSWSEPFNILYLNLSLYTIFNLNDWSWTCGIPLLYKPFDNFEFNISPVIFSGLPNSEFGSKSIEWKTDFQLNIYF